MEEMQKKVCLLNQYCVSLEKELETCKKELHTYQRIYDVFSLYDDHYSQLESVKHEKHQIVVEYLTEKKQLQRLALIQGRYCELQSMYQREVELKTFLQQSNTQLKATVEVLASEIEQKAHVATMEIQNLQNLLNQERAERSMQLQNFKAQIQRLQEEILSSNLTYEALKDKTTNQINILNQEKEVLLQDIAKIEQLLLTKEQELQVLHEKEEENTALKKKFIEAEEKWKAESEGWQKSEQKLSQKIIKLKKILEQQSDNSKVTNITKMIETQLLYNKNKEISELKETISEQKICLQNLSNQVLELKQSIEQRQKEIQSLEESNGVLKKQIITSIQNEQVSLKQMLSIKEESRSNIKQLQSKIAYFRSLKGSTVTESDVCPNSPRSLFSKPRKGSTSIFFQNYVQQRAKFKEFSTNSPINDNKTQKKLVS